MKQSIIAKILIILTIVIGIIFMVSSYLFSQANTKLIKEISEYNLNSSMSALDERQKLELNLDKKQMKNNLEKISKNSSIFLYSDDLDGLKNNLILDIKQDSIKAIAIFDDILNEYFLIVIKENNTTNFKKFIPKKLNSYIKFTTPIYNIDNNIKEKLGSVILYYDESVIINKIDKIKNKIKSNIDKFDVTIDDELSNLNIMHFYISVISLVAILITISILLIRYVNTPLNTLKSGLNDFFLFLQSKKDNVAKIYITSNDEFGQMAKSLNENIVVSAKLHEEIHELNTNLEEKVVDRTFKLGVAMNKTQELLDNAGQGFLTFNTKFIIDDEYSKECERLLDKDIAKKDIAKILFLNNKKEISFKNDILDMLDMKNKIAQKSMISLLPKEVILNKRALKIEYKLLKQNKIMLILTNISSQKKLEKKMQKEQNILKMIVTIIGDSDIFYDTKNDFNYFIKHRDSYIDNKKISLHNINELYRIIHTFKGTFLQLSMNDTASYLHKVESELSEFLSEQDSITNNDILEFLNETQFEIFMDSDLNNINELLGSEFLENENFLSINKEVIKNIENKYVSLIENSNINNKTSKGLLYEIKHLSQKSLLSQLKSYPRLTIQLAQRLSKEIYEFDIVGNENILIPDNFKPFIKSLIHLFRNSIDHGIETPEVRAELGKDEVGTIFCSFNNINNKLQIIVSDDGAGIDVEKIKEKISKDVDTSKLIDEEVYNYIFKDNLSTKDEVTNNSGRGVGMSAIKAEIEKLNGTIKIQSEINVGTTFVFEIEL